MPSVCLIKKKSQHLHRRVGQAHPALGLGRKSVWSALDLPRLHSSQSACRLLMSLLPTIRCAP
jgi:hypothetical protein